MVEPFIAEMNSLGLVCRSVLADAPQRAALKNMKMHSGKFGCDVCYATGVHLKGHGIYYPVAASANQRLRTIGKEFY